MTNQKQDKKLIMLHRISLSDYLFNQILKVFDAHVVEVNPHAFESFKCGYRQKLRIYRCNDEFICQGQYINAITEKETIDYNDDWMQYICRLDPMIDDVAGVYTDFSGVYAWTTFKKMLLKYYTEEEFDEALKAHHADFDENKKQQHYLAYTPQDKIVKFENVIYYDINNAHGSALLEIFPRAGEKIREMYEHRADNDGANKKIFNYFVGMLTRRGYRGTYNWIVQRTTRLLKSRLIDVDGDPIYINTDGAIVANARNPIENSPEFGEFKRKDGEIYVYRAENYYLIQFNEFNGKTTQKGNLPTILRKGVDLSCGKVVKYNKQKVSHHYELTEIEFFEV